jgi:AcrR family transcriptional regulator/quercetin dioxygenase-like cupin family protein
MGAHTTTDQQPAQREQSLRQRHSNLTRELILRTVAEILDESGLADLSVPDVARRAGVSLRTVYRYFPTREQLIAEAGEWIGVNVLAAPISDSLAEIPADFAANASRLDEHPKLALAMALSRGDQSLRSVRRRQRLESLETALREVTDGLPEAEARRAFAVFAYLDNMLAWVTMREEAGLDGREVGEAVAWAMQVLIDDLRRRQRAAARTHQGRKMANVFIRNADEGRTFLVGGGDYVTVKVRGAEVGDEYCMFEASTTPGFGPPLHTHEWAESFYVLEGQFEFQRVAGDRIETITGGPGTTVVVPPGVPHAFRNGLATMSKMLIVHVPAGLESFFEEYGVEVERVGDVPAGVEPPDPAVMGEILPRHGVELVGGPAAVSA